MTIRKVVGDDSGGSPGGIGSVDHGGTVPEEALDAADIAALGQGRRRPRTLRWPWIVLLVIFLAASIFGAVIWKRAEHNSALQGCRDAAGTSLRARLRLRRALSTVASTSASVTPAQVSDGKVVDELKAETSAASSLMGSDKTATVDVQCPVKSSTTSLRSATASIGDNSRAMTRQEKRVREASEAVIASRDAKTLVDAQNGLSTLIDTATAFLDSVEGQTAETGCRDALSAQISTARNLVHAKSGNGSADSSADDLAMRCRDSAASLQSAMDDVSASVARQSGIDCDALKCVALTFDDGPSAVDDVKLRDELEKLKVNATFFMIGRNIGPSTQGNLSRDTQLGNIDGNHSWDHPQLPTLDQASIASQLSRTDAAIAGAGGRRSGLLRPPYGAWNDSVRQVAAQQGDAVILWNVDSEDWKSLDAKATTDTVLDRTKPGSIVLMHSIHASTVQAIPDIVAGLRAKGYVLVTVPQLLGGVPKPGWVYYSQHDMIHMGSTQQVEN